MAVDTVVGRLDKAKRGVGVSGRGPGTPGARRSRSPLGRAGLTLALFALPSLILLVLLNLFPVLYSFVQSFQDGTPSTLPTEANFVGLQNYVNVLTSDQFLQSTLFTIIFTIVGVFGSWLVGVAVARGLRRRNPAGGGV